jgi:hypothetical protein
MPEADLRKYQQQFYMNGRTRKIEYGKYGLVFDEWFVLHPVSDSRFYAEDLRKYVSFRWENQKPVFDRIE